MLKRKNFFDKKFGTAFIESVPRSPGVYEMIDSNGVTIYVGKAKILRRRLQQYRNAKRCKKHLKMRTIIQSTVEIRFTLTNDDLSALLLENKLIQSLKPKFNISGAFSFLYPVIGLVRKDRDLHLIYTTSPEKFQEFHHYGCFRSRYLTKEAFWGFNCLFSHLGHRKPHKKIKLSSFDPFSYAVGFRQISDRWHELFELFLLGRSYEFLEAAVLELLEHRMARRQSSKIQEAIDALKRFYKFESTPLRMTREKNGVKEKFISQKDRDQLFLNAKFAKKNSANLSKASLTHSS